MRNKMTLKSKNAWFGRLFILPWTIGFVFLFLRPMLDSMLFTVQKITIGANGFERKFVGLENFEYAFLKDPEFIREFVGSIRSMALQVPIIIMFSLFIAVILNQKFRGRMLARAVFFLPVIIASGVVIQILKDDVLAQSMNTGGTVYLFSAGGLSAILMQAGFNLEFVNFITNLVNQIFDLSWKSGVQILLFLAGLQSVPAQLYEAANVEGATGWESFWKITFPMVTPIVLVNLIYSVIDSFTDYGNKVMQLIHEAANIQLRYDYSATLSWIYFITVFCIVGLIVGLVSRKVFYTVD